jgi:hypothetical protein
MDGQFDHILRECQAAVKLAGDPGRLDSTALGVLLRAGSALTRWHIVATRAQTLQEVEPIDSGQLRTAHERIIAEIRRRWAMPAASGYSD